MAAAGGGWIDADTRMSAHSADGRPARRRRRADRRRRAARGRGRRAAFCAVRPPGHHATPTDSMGFCLVSNIAVVAAALADAGERVWMFDYDAHHGNGTQAAFVEDPRVLFVSLHQWPLYPGTGRVTETGTGAGRGTTMNVPLPPGATGDVYLQRVRRGDRAGRRALRADVAADLGRVRRPPRRPADRARPDGRRLPAAHRAGAGSSSRPAAAWRCSRAATTSTPCRRARRPCSARWPARRAAPERAEQRAARARRPSPTPRTRVVAARRLIAIVALSGSPPSLPRRHGPRPLRPRPRRAGPAGRALRRRRPPPVPRRRRRARPARRQRRGPSSTST